MGLLAPAPGRPLETTGNSGPREMVATEVRFGTEPGVSADPFPRLDAAQDRDDLAEDAGVVAEDRFVRRVLWQ